MAVNLLEEDRLVYHDTEGRTINIKVPIGSRGRNELIFTTFELGTGAPDQRTIVRRDAVETLRDALTTWLQTGKLKVGD